MKIRSNLFFIGALFYILIAAVYAQPYSDDFYPETTLQSQWRFFDPVGDGSYTMTGTNIEINVPGGVSHDLGSNSSPRILQSVADADFAYEAKFESEMTALYQMQGIVVHANDNNYIRFGTYSTNSNILIYSSVYNPNSSVKVNQTIGTETPSYLRVERTGDNWIFSYSFDGTNFTEAVNFNQTFAVSEVGVYAGNHNPSPAFISSVDYFRDLNDPSFSDTDVSGVTPPILEVWYGDVKDFGNIGNPQKWVNILGRVSDADGIGSLKYSLNGNAYVSLPLGPNNTRLENNGDFVTEIDRADLISGVNTVEIIASDALGVETIRTVTLNYSSGNVWTLPYTADWSNLSSIDDINDLANIVDGLWELTPDGIKTVEPGYDRLIVLGDETWTTNYEVTAEMTIHSASSGSGVGFAIGWQGHEGNVSPRTQWPLEAIGWVRNFSSLRILRYNSIIEASQNVSMSYNTKYLLKAKSEDIGGGISRFSVKIWEEGTTEPASYMITSDIPDRDGSVLLIAHKADVTWGIINIQPLTGNQLPSFTSSPSINAQVGASYTYNITASDPNNADVLTISANTLPNWLSFTDLGNGTAELTGTPASGNIGSHSVELVVSDGNGGLNEQNFTIVVTNSSADLPLSDQFCGPDVNPIWTIFDPYENQAGESTFGINNGILEISIPDGNSHDLENNLSPRLLQTVPDDDFGVEVKFNSVPSTQFQMQGIVVQGTGFRLRFETYFGTEPYFFVKGYGAALSQVNQAIGGAIPAYQRLIRTGNTFEYDVSYDGVNWINVTTQIVNATVSQVGFYGANATPFPAFTMQAEYFRNINDPIPSCSVVEVTSPNGGEIWNGLNTENITWTAADITNVNIEFSSNNGSSWSTIATSVNAANGSFAFTVPNINSINSLIRISDTDNSSIFDISDAAFKINEVVVDPTIIIGSATTVAGSYVTIPIDLTSPSGFKIDYLLQGKIHFDAGKLKFLYGDYDAGTLVNDFGWTGTFYSALPGNVDIILSGANPINNSGTMFYLTFQVIDQNAGNINLTSSSTEWPVDVLETPLKVVNGSISYSGNSGTSENRGDATLNFIVDIFDGLAVIYHWAGIYPLNGQALVNADVNFDGDVDIDDYLRIIFFVYLHDWNFAFPSVSPGTTIALNDASFENSEIISIPVDLENSGNVHSVEVKFDFDSSELEYLNVTQDGSTNGELRTANTDGTITIIKANANEIANGRIANLRFRKLNSSSVPKLFAHYDINSGQISDGKTLSIGSGIITEVNDNFSDLPKEYALAQNFPNPFNPTTLIKFSVPKAGSYHLNLYNILGQKVMTVLNQNLQAGHHSVRLDGSSLSSGFYIYSLEGDGINLSKKMLLLK